MLFPFCSWRREPRFFFFLWFFKREPPPPAAKRRDFTFRCSRRSRKRGLQRKTAKPRLSSRKEPALLLSSGLRRYFNWKDTEKGRRLKGKKPRIKRFFP